MLGNEDTLNYISESTEIQDAKSEISENPPDKNYFVLSPSILNEEKPTHDKFKEIFESRGKYTIKEISGLYFQGIQYFDFKNVFFINNTGIANLLDIQKLLLQEGIELKFVNVSELIKKKFKSLELDCIFNCS